MKTKEENAITLIALVITIIILLILAGVVIIQLTGNGIFDKAKYAKEKYENAKEKEDNELQNSMNLIDMYLNDNTTLTAEIVSFVPDTSDTTINYDDDWKSVKNVKEALDYLYNH